jgi:epoxyqueuosine reductase
VTQVPDRELHGSLAAQGLRVLASFTPSADLRPDPACRTLVLAGPDGRNMWPVFSAAPEVRDGAANPLDRWSRRVVDQIAAGLKARAYYPFGSPHQPFVQWALASRQIWSSPVGLLVHAEAGLQVSFRAALAFDEELESTLALRPCDDCRGKPCLLACPVGALNAEGYDTSACHGFLETAAGQDCLTSGCLVRRACPIGTDLHDSERAGFHMRAFHFTGQT